MKHIIYPTVAKPAMIGGLPRIAMMVTFLIAMSAFLVVGTVMDMLIGMIIAAVVFVLAWAVMLVVSFNDPDHVLIALVHTKVNAKKRGPKDRYDA
jgi:type IV secretory pathway VirB3-like protein